MSYFSRLTDIVTCNLTELLARAEDPAAALQEIIAEMEEGLAGAQRCVNRALKSEQDLSDELADYRGQVSTWVDRARTALESNDEDSARDALLRKGELEDLMAGLEREHAAAVSTRESLATTLRALEARLSDARRRRHDLRRRRCATGCSAPSR